MPNIQQEIRQAFGGEVYDCKVVSAPGRVNLIGEHIDYHGLAVLPIALRQSVRVAYSPRVDRQIRATSAGGYGVREFEWTDRLVPVAVGDWENYLRAAAQAVRPFEFRSGPSDPCHQRRRLWSPGIRMDGPPGARCRG